LPVNSPRHTAGNRRHDISFAIGIACMAMRSSGVFEQWGYGIGRLRHGRHGRTDMRRGSSVRSDGIALIMSLCSATGTFAICSNHIKNITMKPARTYHCTRTRQSRALPRPSVACCPCQSWADYTTNISECEFPTGTAGQLPLAQGIHQDRWHGNRALSGRALGLANGLELVGALADMQLSLFQVYIGPLQATKLRCAKTGEYCRHQ
jgi:hypothetical protein